MGEYFRITGNKPLQGSVTIDGSKNAALAILPATLLARGEFILHKVPDISDVNTMIGILKKLGAAVECDKNDKTTYRIDTTDIEYRELSAADTAGPFDNGMRGSLYLCGALAGAFGKAAVPKPGGDRFGNERPIDLHTMALESLGFSVTEKGNMIHITRSENEAEAVGEGKRRRIEISFSPVSVGATVNTLLAAVLHDGITVIRNAAQEPHIVDLAIFLNNMGADIIGAGTNKITVKGVSQLRPCRHTIIPDQIEAGTFMVMAAAMRGKVTLNDVTQVHLQSIIDALRRCGVKVISNECDGNYDSLTVDAENANLRGFNIETNAHPGFPTDMQSQMAALMTVCDGRSTIRENVFVHRFNYVKDLKKFGARIKVDEDQGKAEIEGIKKLKLPSKLVKIEAEDIRTGAALLTAALMTDGTTVLRGIEHIDRGYDSIEIKLAELNADIKRVKE